MMEEHPLAGLVPRMGETEFHELRDDIAAHGLREAIWTRDGKVLDGRHRLRACSETGAAPRFREYKGDDPAAFVLSVNLRRRHLSASQRAMVATGFLPALEAEANARQGHGKTAPGRNAVGRTAHSDGPQRTRDEAADAAGVSPRLVQQAKRVTSDGPLADSVRSGRLSVGQAEQRLKVVESVRGLGEDAQEEARDGRSPEEILAVASRTDAATALAAREATDARVLAQVSALIAKSNPVEIAKAATLEALARADRTQLERLAGRLREVEQIARELADAADQRLTTPMRRVQ